ncbi:MAG TPA: hypothetical protein VN666_21865 [Nitrospira sp.]|nr:hypothetical protein [Nitrospira sp.]
MTELEWLKQQSGYTDDELKAFESVMGSAKFVTMLQKIQASVSAAEAARKAAEENLLINENNHRNQVVPELRRVTKEAIDAVGENARLKAELEKAREYGIVPEAVTPPAASNEPPRAPGSPDPNSISRDDFGRFENRQSRTIIALNDLNAEHFRLFGSPLGETQALVDDVTREHTLGNKSFTLQQAWERKHNVPAKREELQKAEQQKVIDAAVAAEKKKWNESQGANPNVRSGVPSRFSTYKATDAGKEPWKAPKSKQEANRSWRENAVAKVRAATAA